MSSSDQSSPLLHGAEGFGNYSSIGGRDGVRSDIGGANSLNDTHAPDVGTLNGSVVGVGAGTGVGVG